MIASEIIDYVPLSDSSDENSQPAKKQALDQDLIQTDLSHVLPEISVVGFLVSQCHNNLKLGSFLHFDSLLWYRNVFCMFVWLGLDITFRALHLEENKRESLYKRKLVQNSHFSLGPELRKVIN